jgi:hypothetical protein
MKKEIFIIAFIVLISCNKKIGVDGLNRGKATFKINNTVKNFTQLNSFNKGILALGNTKEEFISLSFPIPNHSLPVTYNTQTRSSLISATYVYKTKNYISTNGLLANTSIGSLEITITKYEGFKISGTFSFTGVDKDDATKKVIITDGVFTDIPNFEFL